MKEEFQYDKPSYDVIPTPTVEGERTGVAVTDIDVQKRYGKPVAKKKRRRLAEEVLLLTEGFAIRGSTPGTEFQKKYGRLVNYRSRSTWQFPGKYGADDGKLIEIPKPVRIGEGLEPSEFILEEMKGAWNAAKSDLGYCYVQDLLDLMGLDSGIIYDSLVWMSRHGQATIGVDRWGYAVSIKLKGV